MNYSEPDPKAQDHDPGRVAYGTDPAKVREILLEIARTTIKTTDFLLEDPEPKTFFTEFGDSGLKFILYVWAKK